MILDEKENYSQDDQNFPESNREFEIESYELSPLEDSDSKNYGQDNNRDFTNQGDYENKDDLDANDSEEDDLDEEDDLEEIDEDSELESEDDFSEK